MTHFWAKTTEEGVPGISVFQHMVNVGCVARCIAEIRPGLLEWFNLQSSIVGALAALHDLGKISPGFQRKCQLWLEENNLAKIDRNWRWDSAMESDHGKVSHAAIQAFFLGKGIDHETGKFVSAILGAHHGRLNPPNDRGYRPQKLISDTASQIDWDAERMANAQMIWDRFVEHPVIINISDDSPSLWWLAGLTSVADWIGSDERFFPPERETKEKDISTFAQKALLTIGIHKTKFVPNLSFHDLFHDAERPEMQWVPNEMQQKALAAIKGPGVYVIEAPMGMGKTEAALWAAYQLLVTGRSSGIYFALPTQVTSNRMYLRMKEFVQRISPASNPTRLIHGNSWLLDQSAVLLPAATSHDSKNNDDRAGRDWFASAKRALIAPFGIGTIDQALLGVVAAKHFFVRHFALAGKVVILDEIHSYDLYTGTLIDKLITTLEALGCTVLVLSATLTAKRRCQMVSRPEDETEDAECPYPLITGRYKGHVLAPLATNPLESRTVKVDFVAKDKAAQEAMAVALNSGAVLWICNTIEAAQKQYRRFMSLAQKEFPIGLLHSRFPYWRREKLEDEWMERFGKSGISRCGSILISTQVVEQSVDLDADFLITELAPTDMLLQRLGRLWRHERGQRPVDRARLWIIDEGNSLQEFREMEPKAIVDALGGKAHVYDPFVLLRTLQVWKNNNYMNIVIPKQIRELIEATYIDRIDNPESWEKLFDDRFVRNSNERFKAAMNSNFWQPQLPDEEGVQTRLNELPTVSVVLCRSIDKQEAVFIDGTSGQLGGEMFRISTAQAIHKNIVKVPEYCFDNIKSCPAIADYLYGNQSVGIVEKNGEVEVYGLKSGSRLYYSDELGLGIEKPS